MSTPDFSFALSPATITVAPNSNTTVTVTQTAIGGFALPVVYTLNMNGNPPNDNVTGSSSIFSAAAFPSNGVPLLSGSGTVDLTIIVLDAPAGTYIGYINGACAQVNTGNDIPLAHNQELTVTVT